MKIFYSFLVLFFFLQSLSQAFAPEKYLDDKAQESRARAIFSQVRCLVCEAQSVESSDTQFSLKMRELIRQKILQGKNDDEIKAELVAEFGDAILLSAAPKNNLLIWILPFVFAVLMGFLIFYKGRLRFVFR